ncbi:PREDICTED: kit ligand-like [Gavialis gangeticus]|uniref:kit ligand-like n=1 Tax=Gavialis gangeticus TaxID=94835 RepID=UPI00092E40D7|nr:PREDICTED: kit ligand-like [Gavialis gangeticus]
MTPTKNLIWIVTFFTLDLLTAAYRLCENSLTDDVDNIPELIKNLPSDYRITLKYVHKVEHVHNHCWLHLMVPEFAKSLNNLLHKFPRTSDASDNHSILNSLTRMINDLLECLTSDRYKDSVHSYQESEFSPKEFFKHFNNMIKIFKAFSTIPADDNCDLFSTTPTLLNDSKVTDPPPVVKSAQDTTSSHLQTMNVTSSSTPKDEKLELPPARRKPAQELQQLIMAEKRAQAILFGLMLILFFISIICLFFTYRSLSQRLKVLSTFVYVKLPPHFTLSLRMRVNSKWLHGPLCFQQGGIMSFFTC